MIRRPQHLGLAALLLLVSVPAEAEEHCLVIKGRGARMKQLENFPQCVDPLAVTVLGRRTSFRLPLEWGPGQRPSEQILHIVRLEKKPEDSESRAVTLQVRRAASDAGAAARSLLPEPKRLSGEEAANYDPLWSPDGRFLAWQQIGDRPALYVYDTGSGQLRKLGDLDSLLPSDQQPNDEDSLAGRTRAQVSSFAWDPGAPWLYLKLKQRKDLLEIDVSQLGPLKARPSTRLPRASEITFSPDGRYLAWRPSGQETGLRVRSLQTGDERELCDRRYYCRGVRFAPNGQSLVFWRSEQTRGGPGESFWVLAVRLPKNLASGALASSVLSANDRSQGSTQSGTGLGASWSPSGKRIAFLDGERIQVFETRKLFGASPPEARYLMVGADGDKSDPAWLGESHLMYVQRSDIDFPISVVEVATGEPLVVSERYELHYDLTLAPSRPGQPQRLAYAAFDRQQSIMLSELPQPFPPKSVAARPLPELVLDADGQAIDVKWKGKNKHKIADDLLLTVRGKVGRRGKGTLDIRILRTRLRPRKKR